MIHILDERLPFTKGMEFKTVCGKPTTNVTVIGIGMIMPTHDRDGEPGLIVDCDDCIYELLTILFNMER